MKYTLLVLIVLSCFFYSCKNENEEQNSLSNEIINKSSGFTKLWKKDIKVDSTLSVRAIEIINDDIYYSSDSGQNGIIFSNGAFLTGLVHNDSIKYSFRSSSFSGKNLFFMSINSPALLYKLDYNANAKSYIKHTLVYQENHKKAFYDSMDFWNDEEGIAIGDPTDNCLSIIITRDGGNTWNKLPCDILPEAKEGEAAFAASDTNIAIVGDKTWVATGGKASRVLFSPDKGKSWEVFETPIVQGLETTGIYSIDFYDELNGFAIGGDYTKADDNAANKIRTTDGGKTWDLVAENQNPGYRSCVQYVPNSNAKQLVAVGFKGIDYSSDSGNTWKHLSDEGYYTIRFLNDSIAYAAGNGRVSKITFRE